MTPEQRLDLLDDLLRRAKRAGADAADAVMMAGRSVSVAWRLGELERLEREETEDLGLRVLVGKRQAVVSSADIASGALDELVSRAVAMARTVPEDPFCGLAAPEDLARDIPDLDSRDPVERDAETLIAWARACEEAALAVPGVTNSEGAEASWSRGLVALAATNGFAHAYEGSNTSLSASVLAGTTESGMERDYDYSTAVYAEDLRAPEDVGRRAAERAVRRSGARKGPTGRFPVLFEERVARSLLGHFLGAVNGSAVARGTSFLKDRLGEAVFAPHVTISEDPHRPRGLRSRPCDGEGLPTKARALVQDGRLTTWLLDLRSARKLGLPATGHAARGAGAAPSPAPTNVWLHAGARSPEEMVKAMGRGLLVTELFGMGVNGVTGDYSRGASGFWIEDGVVAWPVNEITVAGNLKDMFASLEPADDLSLRHATDSPSVLIESMMVAGN